MDRVSGAVVNASQPTTDTLSTGNTNSALQLNAPPFACNTEPIVRIAFDDAIVTNDAQRTITCTDNNYVVHYGPVFTSQVVCYELNGSFQHLTISHRAPTTTRPRESAMVGVVTSSPLTETTSRYSWRCSNHKKQCLVWLTGAYQDPGIYTDQNSVRCMFGPNQGTTVSVSNAQIICRAPASNWQV